MAVELTPTNAGTASKETTMAYVLVWMIADMVREHVLTHEGNWLPIKWLPKVEGDNIYLFESRERAAYMCRALATNGLFRACQPHHV